MEKAYRVNIDYDLQVAVESTKPLKPNWQREWEYLFWWVEPHDKLLSSHFQYHEDDLKYIESQTGRQHFFSQSDQIENWWGSLNQQKLKKTDLPEIREKLYSDFESHRGKPIHYPCVLKKDGSFSGKGVYFLQSEADFLKLQKLSDYITEPFRDIVLDFSYYQFQDKRVYYRSVVKDGQYLGSLFSKNNEWIRDANELNLKADKLRDSLDIKEYGVDCYYYKKDNEIKLEALCEINSRKTIASVVYQIYQKYFPDYAFAKNLILPMKKIDIDDVIEKISIKTRQYAKRQTTWGRGNMEGWNKINPIELNKFLKKI